MEVKKTKIILWAKEMERALRFYEKALGAEVVKRSEVISEVTVAGVTIGIHGGGEGKRTWTGMSFQVGDVITAAAEVVAHGGTLDREPQPENGEPPHLAMCVDPEGNQFMLTRPR